MSKNNLKLYIKENKINMSVLSKDLEISRTTLYQAINGQKVNQDTIEKLKIKLSIDDSYFDNNTVQPVSLTTITNNEVFKLQNQVKELTDELQEIQRQLSLFKKELAKKADKSF